jgi:hypothetical protein
VSEKRFEWPKDQLDALNARLDFEYEADRYKILYSDQIRIDRKETYRHF